MRNLLLTLGLLLLALPLMAQKTMKGKVQEFETKAPMFGVYIENINTQRGVMTDSFGNFELEVAPGELVEIQKFTFKTIRIRIPKSALPSFFVLDMEYEVEEMEMVKIISDAPQHVRDSIKKTEVYRSYLNFYRKEDINPVQNPFDFLSKRNRQIWAFQQAFDIWEREKFIDYVFNDKLILKITELNEAALPAYKHYFRPSYELIKSFSNDYEYYLYIKRTSYEFLRNKEMHSYNPD